MKSIKSILLLVIVASLLTSCAATTKYGCPPAKQGARHDKNLRF